MRSRNRLWAGLTEQVHGWSGALVRFTLLAVVLCLGCPGQPVSPQCELRIDVPEKLNVAVGSSTDFTVRFFNPTSKAIQVSELSVSPPFSFRDGTSKFSIGEGTCEAPGEVGVVLGFSPTAFGLQRADLTMLADGAPRVVNLSAMATGPRLSAASVVSFGLTGLLPSLPRPLAVRNVGTVDTSLWVEVVSVTAANATTSPDELCVGSVELGQCQASSRVTVRRDASFALVVVPTSTGPKSWTVELRAGDTRWTTRVSAVVVDTTDCELSASPAVLNFGLVPGGQRVRRSVTLRTTGSTSCVVTATRTNDTRRFEVMSPQRTVLPRESQRVDIDAVANKPPEVLSTLTFELAPSDPQQPTKLEVRLETAPPLPCLAVSPLALDFGTVRADCRSQDRSFMLYNTCAEPLFVASASTELPFSIVQPIPAAGVMLSLGGPPTVLQIRYTPGGTIGSTSGALRIISGLGVTDLVVLQGRSDPSGLNTDTFQSDARVLSDIVIILDDSPSFARQHANTRAELDRLALYSNAIKHVSNSRVAFTTTDVSASGPQGRFRSTDGGQRWASADDPSFLSTFAALSTLSTAGAEHQSCLEAAARAVTGPLASDPQANAGFSRPNASLSFLCVTDDVENTANPGLWRSALEGLDAGTRLSYSVMGPFGSACPVDALDVGGSHLASIRAFNGVASDVCRPWGIYGLTGLPSPPRTNFFLTGTPDVATLVVTVNGTVIPPRTAGQTNWTYDSRTNAITFAPSLFGLDPPPITISYRTVCP